VNQDFSSLRSVFQGRGGRTIFGTGTATGGDYVKNALEELAICPLLYLGDRPTQLDRILVNVIGGADLTIAKVNEIMMEVTQRFGSREDIVFGAVIDKSRNESVELCILGKAEMDHFVAAPPVEADPQIPRKIMNPGLGLETEISRGERYPRPVHRSKLRRENHSETNQDEFTFIDSEVQRGYFDKTDRNEYNNEDLDVPTFMRRGIKIRIK
jgi:cell division protein FtsZ